MKMRINPTALSSSRQPSKDAISKWNNVLNFAKMPVKSTFGPGSSRLTKRWGGGDDASASFRAPTPDPCLLQAFDKAKTANKSLVDSASAIASSSGAAAHAILSASETLENCIAEFQRIAASQEEGWKDFFLNSAEVLKLNALAPLNDGLSSSFSLQPRGWRCPLWCRCSRGNAGQARSQGCSPFRRLLFRGSR